VLELPESLRAELKTPLGDIYTDPAALLAVVDEHATSTATADQPAEPRLVAVGDVVTATLADAGRQPDVAVIDGRTEREPVDPAVEATLADLEGRRLSVANPPATLSESLLRTLRDAVTATELPLTISVDGEEDLAALPAILAAPASASVVYGQPNEGMVHVPVTAAVRTTARELLADFDGDTDAATSLLD
jgi:Uncharacterized protein conserved in archaea